MGAPPPSPENTPPRPGLTGAPLAPFRSSGGGADRPLVALFVLVNGLVLLNAVFHPPAVGYDALAHFRYIRALSQLRLPTAQDTYEFFSPPLPYLLPAAFVPAGADGLPGVGKLAQALNVLYSIGATFFLLKAADLVRPGSAAFKRTALLLLGMVPVYYKTFAFVRPEPLLTLLWVLAAYQSLRVFVGGETGARGVVWLGVLLGLLVLARQQGFFWIFAVLVFVTIRWARDRETRLLRAAAVALVTAFVVGGWYYLILQAKYGTTMAYAKERPSFSLANQPSEFYLGTGDGKLFTDPVRPAFRNQLVPKLYAETWGDYECYFLVYGFDRRTGRILSGYEIEDSVPRKRARFWLETNRETMGRYLGRVNLVSLLPSAILLGGLAVGLGCLVRLARGSAGIPEAALAVVALGVLVSLGAFVLLLVAYGSRSGNMLKATYVIQVFPLLALLGAELLGRVQARWPRMHRGLLVALLLVAAHNGLACVTGYRAAGSGD